MPVTGKNINLNNFKKIICINGLFDDFNNSTETDNQFTNNGSNVNGSFSQTGGEIIWTASSSSSKGCKYQNDLILDPIKGFPFPYYSDFLLETRVKFSSDTGTDMVGLRINAANNAFTTGTSGSNIFYIGIFSDTSGDNGIRIRYPERSTGFPSVDSDYTSITVSPNTYYNLQVSIYYNELRINDITRKKIIINVWLDGVKVVTDFDTLDSRSLDGYRMDGSNGLIAEIDTGTATFDYFCSNRLEFIINSETFLKTIFENGTCLITATDVNRRNLQKVGQRAKTNIYARSLISENFTKYWTGYISEIIDIFDKRQIKIEGMHISQILNFRYYTGSFSNKRTDEIITTVFGAEASDFDISNIKAGTILLTKDYFEKSLTEIIIDLVQEEDYISWITNDKELKFEPIGLNDNGLYYDTTLSNINKYEINNITNLKYTTVEVQGSNINVIVEDSFSKLNEKIIIKKIIADTTITTEEEALRIARSELIKTESFQIGILTIKTDYTIEIGDTITLTLPDESIGYNEKRFLVIDINTKLYKNIQMITLSTQTTAIADILANKFKKSEKNTIEGIDIDASQITKIYVDINLDIWSTYLIETSTNGTDYTEHASGKATICNRAIAILSAVFGNKVFDAGEGNFASPNGNFMIIGTGTTKAKVTNQNLNTKIASSDNRFVGGYDNTTRAEKCQKVYGTGDHNGNDITEAGYYVKRTDCSTLSNSTYKYATDSFFAPYNNDEDILVHAVFPAFSKTVTHYFRVTFYVYIDNGLVSKVRSSL